jgi:hypothetical protein
MAAGSSLVDPGGSAVAADGAMAFNAATRWPMFQ